MLNHMMERIECYLRGKSEYVATKEDYAPQKVKLGKIRQYKIPMVNPIPAKYYLNLNKVHIHDTLHVYDIRVKSTWNTSSSDYIEVTPDCLAGILDDGRVIPHYVKLGSWILTRRGWEVLRETILKKEKEFNDKAKVKYIYHTDHNAEVLLQTELRKIENKINTQKEYLLLMEEAAELYRPKRTWFSKKVYAFKMYILKKILGQ